jgi:hypothetical protein
MKYWFEIFITHSDGSTETVDCLKTLQKTKEQLLKDVNLKADLWISNKDESELDLPIGEIKVNSTLEDIDNILLNNADITQELREFIIEI